MTKHVAIVCAGNYCRSPMAQQVFAKHIPDVTFSSAGLQPHWYGGPMAATAAELLAARGYDSGHVCRGVTYATLEADLVLAVEYAHRAALIALGAPRERVRMLTDFDPRSTAGEEVCNPYLAMSDVYVAVLGLIERCVPALTRELEKS